MVSWKERYFDLVDGLNVGVYRNTPGKRGRFLEVNKAMVSIFEAESKENLLKIDVSSVYVNPASRQAFSRKLMEKGFVKNAELKLKTLKGKSFWASITAIKKEQGSNVYFLGIVEDITLRKRREEKIRLLNRRLSDLSLRDPHTGLYNYRYLEEALKSELSYSRRHHAPFALFMLDLDYFKSVNDVYGHQFGDLILKQFARKLESMVRGYDKVVRFGGEEFIIISRALDRHSASLFAERLMRDIESVSFGNSRNKIKVKFSMGIITYPQNISAPLDLVDKADAALNAAKEKGGGFSFYEEKPLIRMSRQRSKDSNMLVKSILVKMDNIAHRLTQNMWEEAFAFSQKVSLEEGYKMRALLQTEKTAAQFAIALGIGKEDKDIFRKAVLLRDLGKAGIPKKVLLKKRPLTAREWESVKAHPQLSADIIRNIPFSEKVVPLVLYHHERWDGKGYPYALAGKDIPYLARAVSIVDSFQALVSVRPWRKAYTASEAKNIIASEAGKKFDPALVKVFLTLSA